MYGQNYNGYPYGAYGMPNYAQRQFMQPQQPQVQQQVPMQPQPQQTMQYETPIQDIRFVTSEEAKAFIVMPNSKALLIDKNSGLAHLKTADNLGQSVTQYFKFEQVNADGTPVKQQEPTPQVDFGQFVKKDELSGFVTVEQHKQLLDKLEVMQQIMVGGKVNGNGNGNGIASAKQASQARQQNPQV